KESLKIKCSLSHDLCSISSCLYAVFPEQQCQILLSDNFRTSFQKLDSSALKKLVMNLLLRLSYGLRPRRRKTDVECENSKQIVKNFRVRHLLVLCSVDIVMDSGLHSQVLKIWDIVSSLDMQFLVKRLDTVFALHSDGYINRCKEKSFEGILEVPTTWKQGIARYKSTCSAETGNASAEICMTNDSLMLMKFYSLSSGIIRNLLSGCDGQEVDFPLELSDQEKEIVQFDKSSFVLGRSGSGKTTVLVMKLFQREQLHHIAYQGFHGQGDAVETDGGSVLKQMFVTVNPRLCHVVKQHISRLKRSTCGWNFTAESAELELDEIDETSLSLDFPDSFFEIPSNCFPLIITFKKFLLMLDATVGISFFERFPEAVRHDKFKSSKSLTLQTFIRTREVGYEKFSSSYWRHMNQKILSKSVDPFLVFTEITSHIKGGFQALEASGGHLSREDYVSQSERRLSNLTELERGRIYDIYLEYEKKKVKNGEFDLADFVSDILLRLRGEGFIKAQVDYVYVDEVQDLTMKQIALFKHVCSNVEEGFLFTGDTAQAISKGVEFRFKDIRSLFYETFMLNSGCLGASRGNAKQQLSEVFQLSQNFRTHAGVLKLAQSVIDLIYYFFPRSIDELNPETSHLDGEMPVLLHSLNNKSIFNCMSEVYFGADKKSWEFGAEQVILVRDEDVKNNVLCQVGKQALVLTILECKGLEFEDVLLYDFFGSSPVADQWEVLNIYMKAYKLSPNDESVSPNLNEGKLVSLCHELKLLYVAITRTRQRFWIFDEIWNPMLELWKQMGIVRLQQFDSEVLQMMQAPSTREAWKSRGKKFFHLQNYDTARMCFQKAGEPYWEKYCEASALRTTADQMRSSDPENSSRCLSDAALIYCKIGKDELAAQCYFELQDYVKAGEIYLEKFGASKLQEAGECFCLAKCYWRATQVYYKSNAYVKCLSACIDGRLFETGYDYIQQWRKGGVSDFKEFAEFLKKGARHFQRLENYEFMMMFVRALNSKDQMRSFLQKRDLLDCLILLEEEWGNYLKAADIAMDIGLETVAANNRERGGQYQEACYVILRHVLGESLWGSSNKGWPMKEFERKKRLLNQAETCAKHVSEAYYEVVCKEKAVLSCENGNSLQVLANSFEYFQKQGNLRNVILSARKVIDIFTDSSASCNYEKDVLVADILRYPSSTSMSWKCLSFKKLDVYWKSWKRRIDEVISYCNGHDHGDSHGEFCMEYLGVREQKKGNETQYVVLYPDAAWFGSNISSKVVQNKKKQIRVNGDQFWKAASDYWSTERLVVGEKVLQRLENVYEYCFQNSLSIYCRSMLLVQIFELYCSLFASELTDLVQTKFTDLVQRFVEHYTENILNVSFLEPNESLRNHMTNVRMLEVFKGPFEEVFRYYIENLSHKVSYRQIAEVTAVALSGKLYHQTQQMLIPTLKQNSVCSSCIEEATRPLEVTGTPVSDEEERSIVMELHRAVEHMYYAEFEKAEDTMSPSCLVYLLDRLLILSLAVKGYFYCPRSSVVEWLMHNGWCYAFSTSTSEQSYVEDALELVSCIVKDIFCNEHDCNTPRWTKSFNEKQDSYPLVVLRLVAIVCMLNINTGKCSDLLSNILSRREITSLSPREFYGSLTSTRCQDTANRPVVAFSDALAKINNPLVYVDLKKGSSRTKSKPPSAAIIFLDTKVVGRQKILKKLLPRNMSPSANRFRFEKNEKQ
ncbi:TPR and ankyrin repeat-containing protein 1, partial [Linum grandiflorum]